MMIIGCDFHTRYQQIVIMATETGELLDQRLDHASGDARAFCVNLPKPRVGDLAIVSCPGPQTVSAEGTAQVVSGTVTDTVRDAGFLVEFWVPRPSLLKGGAFTW